MTPTSTYQTGPGPYTSAPATSVGPGLAQRPRGLLGVGGGLAVMGPALVAEPMGCCGLRVTALLQEPTPGASQRGPQVKVALLRELLRA